LEIIGERAFYRNSLSGELDLSGLTNLTTIGRFAFDLNQIESIKLPSSVETIGEYAFSKFDSNQNLTTIINPSGNVFNWSSITHSNTPDQSFATGTITHQNGNIEVKAK